MSASVSISGQVKSQIEQGLLILLGIEDADTDEDVEWLCRKVVVLDGSCKLWTDEDGVMYVGVIPFLLEDKLDEIIGG